MYGALIIGEGVIGFFVLILALTVVGQFWWLIMIGFVLLAAFTIFCEWIGRKHYEALIAESKARVENARTYYGRKSVS